MSNIIIIDKDVVDTLIRDIKEIKQKLIMKASVKSNTKQEYYSVAESAEITGLSEQAIYQIVTKLEKKQEEENIRPKLVVRYGKNTIRLPYNTLHNIVLR